MLTVVAAAAVLVSPLTNFEGHWRCEGRFIASGKPIASELVMTADSASGVFLVRHDDTAPMPYHSIEVWTVDPDGRGLHAAVSDRFSGLRVFRSPPVQDGVLTFSRPQGEPAQEEFRYTLKSSRELQIDWSIAGREQPLRLGDTLSCARKDV